MEEAESQDGVHGLESVGWIAVEPGGDGSSGVATSVGGIGSNFVNNVDYGTTYTDAVVLAETQTQNDPDTGNIELRNIGNSDVDLRFEEDISVDGGTGHAAETVGLVTFESGLILCFTPGTRIATPFGPRPICTLRPGDPVLTRDLGPQPLLWRTETEVDGYGDHAPIIVKAGSLGPDHPERETIVSPQHKILVRGWKAQLFAGVSEVLVPAKALVDGRGVRVVPRQRVRYVHLLFEQHHIMNGDGLLSESLHPGQLDKNALSDCARYEILNLFPDLATGDQNYGVLARPAMRVAEGRIFA